MKPFHWGSRSIGKPSKWGGFITSGSVPGEVDVYSRETKRL